MSKMDKGAHFYACDFQVHSPRDPQWQGNGAVTAAERQAYSVEFVAACRQKGIGAVAITDHHDMAFVPYIRAAAEEERDANGNLLPANRRLVVFPGMELTLGVPCQALLIFDSTFPHDLFSLVRTALAINQTADSEEKGVQAVRLESITKLSQLHDELDKHEYLRGHYIVLPNVSERGPSTLLRSGHQGHYKEMPCIGGYLDGAITQLGDGNKTILAGLNAQYGNKPLALFQTSDNRRRDFTDLGNHLTWVKWATPTAEALRQACLARESRISQTPAVIPSVVVESISVSNSRFLGPVVLEFNPQYNALIGGRGTGKSTILEYLRWALCDDPPAVGDDTEEATDYQAKRRRLVNRTLVELGANVQVTLVAHGVPHVVRRNATNGELQLKIGTGEFEPCSESDIKTLLPIQAYSQKQLSGVGVRLDELRRFLRAPIRQALEEVSDRFADVADRSRAEYARLRRSREARRNLEIVERDSRSHSEQVQSLRTGMQGLTTADEGIMRQRAAYDEEEQIVGAWNEDLRRTAAGIAALQRSTGGMPTAASVELAPLPNGAALGAIQRQLAAVFASIGDGLGTLDAAVAAAGDPQTDLGGALASWREARDRFDELYQDAKTRSSANQVTLSQLQELEGRNRGLRERGTSIRAELASIEGAEAAYQALREEWRRLHQQRADLLLAQCERLTAASDGQIRVHLRRSVGVAMIADRLKSITSGTNIRSAKIERVSERIAAAGDPLGDWFAILDELEKLIGLDQTATIPSTPLLTELGLSDSDLRKIASKLTTDAWVDLSLVILEDAPVFEYRSRESEYMPFAEASAGQQATALLWALLNQEGPPLIIDQPEDDLDNQVMLQIVGQIWKAKTRRQLIFSSHNANLVVNGDAELVVCCDYRVAGEQSSGMLKYQGAIDMDEIRAEIATVMEGGRAAFKLRHDKYGF
jgi:chromosome segregation protein